jgi:hypothetical protein
LQNAGVRERVFRLLLGYRENERVLDAYWQWATNPTPHSAGYALEENGGFIATNLLIRYGHPGIQVVTELSDSVEQLRAEASVADLQQAVMQVLNGPVGDELRQGVLIRLQEPRPARRMLVLWLINRARWSCRMGQVPTAGGEIDWALGIDLQTAARDLKTTVATALFGRPVQGIDLAREAVAVGAANRLFYRSIAGRMEPKLRPGPQVNLSALTY